MAMARSARRLRGPAAAALVVLALAACGTSKHAEPPPTKLRSEPVSDGQLLEGEFTVLADQTHGPHLCTFVEASLPPQCRGLPVTNWDWDAVESEEQRRGTTWGGWHVTGTYADGRFTLVGTPTPPAPDSDEPDGDSLDPSDSVDFSPACDEPVGDVSVGADAWEAATQSATWPGNEVRVVTGWVSTPGNNDGGSFVGNLDGATVVGNLVVLPGAKDEIEARIRESYAGPLCVVERDGPTEKELAAVQRELNDPEARQILGVVSEASADGRRGVVVGRVWVVTAEVAEYAHKRWGDLVQLFGYLTPID